MLGLGWLELELKATLLICANSVNDFAERMESQHRIEVWEGQIQ
jgi:hypothetical protein